MYIFIDKYNCYLGFVYGSFFEMPGKSVSPKIRSYYFGTEGVEPKLTMTTSVHGPIKDECELDLTSSPAE
jgi:hypothetical protein